MKKLAREEELRLLDECVNEGLCDKLFRYYLKTVYFTVRKTFILVGVPFSEEDIEDLRNEVFMKLLDKQYRKLRQYNKDMGLSLTNWIRMIAYQTVIMHLRKKEPMSLSGQRRRISFDDLKEEFKSEDGERGSGSDFICSQVTEELDNVIRRLENREILTRIIKKTAELSHREQLVFKLHFWEGESFENIASYMNEDIGNIYTIKSRAIRRLKELVAADINK